VCTVDPDYKIEGDEDAEVIYDLSAFMKEHQFDDEVYFVCGGASIYRQAYPYCQKAYISFVKGKHEVDTYFDIFSMEDWIIDKEINYDEFIYREMSRKNELIVTSD